MFELFLRLQHECPYNDLSRKYPEARISQWCNGSADILEIEANGLETFEQLQKELNSVSNTKSSKIISKTLCQDKFQLVARTCYCGAYGTSAGSIIAKNNFMEVPPTVLMGGWEHYRLVGFDDSDVRGLLKGLDRIGKTEVLRKKSLSENVTDDNFLLSLSSLFGQLTEKQLKALVSAIENGYYEIPKRVTADELARKQGQPRSTLEEHIRKAESKIVMAMAPYMMMYARVPGSPFNATRAAGATVGARMMKEIAVQAAAKVR
ncbi:MAG TPA: helix-turn-helix domain-containing protein [Candidatus Bathyarchaeia archaeon]|jgi:predicted DNA binding protein|nr:helix-turn-helix domain-containing protein [Candidatus Bathyarchaeia archaeon]